MLLIYRGSKSVSLKWISASCARLKRKRSLGIQEWDPHGRKEAQDLVARKGRARLCVWCICIYLALINGGHKKEGNGCVEGRAKFRSKLINQFNFLPDESFPRSRGSRLNSTNKQQIVRDRYSQWTTPATGYKFLLFVLCFAYTHRGRARIAIKINFHSACNLASPPLPPLTSAPATLFYVRRISETPLLIPPCPARKRGA